MNKKQACTEFPFHFFRRLYLLSHLPGTSTLAGEQLWQVCMLLFCNPRKIMKWNENSVQPSTSLSWSVRGGDAVLLHISKNWKNKKNKRHPHQERNFQGICQKAFARPRRESFSAKPLLPYVYAWVPWSYLDGQNTHFFSYRRKHREITTRRDRHKKQQ